MLIPYVGVPLYVVFGGRKLAALSRWYEAVLADCDALAPAGRVRRLVEGVARLVGPLA